MEPQLISSLEAPASNRERRPFSKRFSAIKQARGLKGLLSALAEPRGVIFLDIETTGLSWFYDEITLVGWACEGRYRVHVSGDDLSPLQGALRSADTLVTFNGTCFDLRFLARTFPDLVLPPTHVDLRYLARRVGLIGGQKAIEQELAFPPRSGVEAVDGREAVLQWYRYQRGDDEALRLLIEYNRWDVSRMGAILDEVLERLDPHPDLWFSRPRFCNPTQLVSGFRAEGKIGQRPRRSKHTHPYEALFSGTAARDAIIVGIDLTGSEKRPSGWCTLRGQWAETSMVSSDEEIVNRVLRELPEVVSIDSPLSIPFGRARTEDDDPTRQEFGIMRRCERELKRRGINVYPCLLPSMQALTRRGMRLAERLRSFGIPVIESYPGAAQDIMRLPRKGAGPELLKQGLVDFGLQGRFVDGEATHDELDAITCALVGSFFLSGRWEALRGPSEGALIVPVLEAQGGSGMVIGLSGRICAGKTTTARVLEERGFAYTRFSMVIDDEIARRGEPLCRETRQRVGAEINRAQGQRWLCEKVLEGVEGQQFVVVDGLRFPEDHAFFVERFGSEFVHLHLTAPDELRTDRYRKYEQDGVPFEVADRQPVEARIDELRPLAHAILQNDSSLGDLRDNALDCLRRVAQGRGRECLSRLS
jgi:predicted nuclease with RNAse H fold/dephospho-CoA kinase